MTFNLIDEPWILVTQGDATREISLRTALFDADEIQDLSWSDPLQAVAILRQVILPVVLDGVGPPATIEEWITRWNARRFDPIALETYLDEQRPRFELLDIRAPFAQVGDLRTVQDETKPISLIEPALATGNNVPLFSARTEADPAPLTPAQAVRALLATHCWDTAAIKSGAAGDPSVKSGKTTGNPTGPLGQLGVVIATGTTLFETLMFNTLISAAGAQPADRPQWRATPATAVWGSPAVKGPLHLLTWQSRRVRLIPEEIDGEIAIRRVVLCAGDRIPLLPPDAELHTAWRRVDKPKAGEAPSRPIRHQPGKAAWRGLSALLAADGSDAPQPLQQLATLRASGMMPSDVIVNARTVGVVYGNQSAVIEDVLADAVPIPIAALTQDHPVRDFLLTVVSDADLLWRAANHLGDDLRAAVGAQKVPWDKSQRLGDVVVHGLGPVVNRLLRGLQAQPEEVGRAAVAWQVSARRVAEAAAETLLQAQPPSAFLGRPPNNDKANKKASFVPRVSTAERSFRRALNEVLGPRQVARSSETLGSPRV